MHLNPSILHFNNFNELKYVNRIKLNNIKLNDILIHQYYHN